MVLNAGVEVREGVTVTEVTLLAFDEEPVPELDEDPVGDTGFVAPVVVPVGSVEKPVVVDCIALASEAVPAPHPQPQKASVISKKKNKKNGRLCDWR